MGKPQKSQNSPGRRSPGSGGFGCRATFATQIQTGLKEQYGL
jgi:hypothetical protein